VVNRGASVYHPLTSLSKGVRHYITALIFLFLTVILSDQMHNYGTLLGHGNGVYYCICYGGTEGAASSLSSRNESSLKGERHLFISAVGILAVLEHQ